MTYEPYKVGDRIRVVGTGREGVVTHVPEPRRMANRTVAQRRGMAQKHFGITIRWDDPHPITGEVVEAKSTVHAGKFERVS